MLICLLDFKKSLLEGGLHRPALAGSRPQEAFSPPPSFPFHPLLRSLFTPSFVRAFQNL